MLIDANLLLFTVNIDSPFHAKARNWLNDQLSGDRRIGIRIEICSTDTDFARFTEIRWHNPLAD
jgi:hypothetical protein